MSSIDNDEGNDDLIDRNPFNLTINPSTNDSSWSSLITTNGFYDKVQFTVQVQLSCSTGWTGSDCNQCIPRTGCCKLSVPTFFQYNDADIKKLSLISFFLYSSN